MSNEIHANDVGTRFIMTIQEGTTVVNISGANPLSVFIKKPDDGSMKGLAFIKDPDGYWIEILNAEATAGLTK